MNRKLFTLIFTIAFTFITVLGCFSAISVSANTIYISDDDYSHAKDILGAICPEMPLSEGEVTTRADFVTAVAMVLKATKAPKGTETGFSDVPKTHPYSSYIAFAKNAGLISTVDLFYPDSPITYNQAIKILMCAAGYGERAEQTGGFPSGYLMAARDANVGQLIEASETDAITHAEAIQLIFEAAIADMMEVTSWGDSFDYSITPGKNILSNYHKIYIANGIVDANENTTLIDSVSNIGDDAIRINGKTFLAPGYTSLIGKNARVFYSEENKNKVLYAYENENKCYEYTQDDSLKISGTKLTVSPKDSTKDVNYTLKLGYSVIVNGKWYGAADYNTAVNPTSGYVTLVDNDRDNVIDVIIVKDIQYGIIGSVDEFEGKIYDKYRKGGLVDLSGSDTNYMITKSDGTEMALQDLESGFVVGYAISKDKKLVEVIHFTDRVGGTFDSRTTDGKLELKGVEYQLSSYYSTNIKDIEKIKFGSEVILHLGLGNQVIYVEEFSTAIKYGFVVDAGKLDGLGAKTMVKLYNEDGEMEVLSCAEKVKFDGVPVSSATTIKAELDKILGRQYAYRVIKYALNANGELSKVFTPVENTNGTGAIYTQVIDEARPVIYFDCTEIKADKLATLDSETNIEDVFVSTTIPYYIRGAFNPYFHLSSEAKAMQVPVRPSGFADEDNFSILDSSSMEDESLRVAAYDVTTGGAASFVLVNRDSSGGGAITRYSGSAIIESITDGVNEDGEAVKILKLYYGGAWVKYYFQQDVSEIRIDNNTTNPATSAQTELDINDFGPGDIIKVSASNDGVIQEMVMNYDCSKREVSEALKYTRVTGKYADYVTGYALSISGDKKGMLAMDMKLDDIDAVNGNVPVANAFSANLSRGTTIFVTFNLDRQTKAVQNAVVSNEASLDSVATYFNSGKDAYYMVLRQYYREPSLNVIYVNIDEAYPE